MRTGLAGNLCRCTGYAAIYQSITEANRRRPSSERESLGSSAAPAARASGGGAPRAIRTRHKKMTTGL
jgi:xanthine dehydrogenase iron-sulfur cluster and FAD-binding subunit A